VQFFYGYPMFERIKNFMSQGEKLDSSFTEENDIVRFAIVSLLIHCAKCDSDFSDSEYDFIANIAKTKLALPHAAVAELLNSEQHDSALTESLSLLRSELDLEQREKVASLAWAVIGHDAAADSEESAFAVEMRKKLGLSLEQAIRARKLAEGIAIDGVKEFVEASSEVTAAVQTIRKLPQ
jgi:uncharacterized tellurite resistance protein B-like protein